MSNSTVSSMRYLHPDNTPSWLDQGLGKFRYGGDGLLRVNEAALVMNARFQWDWSGTVTLKYSDHQNGKGQVLT